MSDDQPDNPGGGADSLRPPERNEIDEEGASTAAETGSADTSLPPPAFPPGARRREVAERVSNPAPTSDGEEKEIPGGAFISPDDPIRTKARGIPDAAFISPDDPLVPVQRNEEGQVTGLGLLANPSSEPVSFRRQTPSIHELPYLLDQLAEHLHESGERALEVHAEMGHFQAALRSFLRGYLEGGRD